MANQQVFLFQPEGNEAYDEERTITLQENAKRFQFAACSPDLLTVDCDFDRKKVSSRRNGIKLLPIGFGLRNVSVLALKLTLHKWMKSRNEFTGLI